MAKHTKKVRKHFRNASPPRPRAPRSAKPEDETPLRRLAVTAGGALGTAFLGGFLARQGWAPNTVTTALTAVGAGLAWKGDDPTIRSVGAGVMSAAGSQLTRSMLEKPHVKDEKRAEEKKQPNADSLPPGALEAALERAQARLALSAHAMDV
ncbi:MAG: hypothetical protein KIT31_16230 [Deltaproteobacteria bacterium]|nr:hypothetical protein [Deltaproteobacteria bacterium]